MLKPGDPGSFTDLEKQAPPAYMGADAVCCPQCLWYGQWILILNAYDFGSKPDTPENRARYSHFRAFCVQCEGKGWRPRGPYADCIHTYREYLIGRCLHKLVCTKCGHTRVIDSSD